MEAKLERKLAAIRNAAKIMRNWSSLEFEEEEEMSCEAVELAVVPRNDHSLLRTCTPEQASASRLTMYYHAPHLPSF